MKITVSFQTEQIEILKTREKGSNHREADHFNTDDRAYCR